MMMMMMMSDNDDGADVGVMCCQNEYLQGTAEFTEVELEASKSSLIFSIIEEEETPTQASTQSMLNYLRGVDHEYNRSNMFYLLLVIIIYLPEV